MDYDSIFWYIIFFDRCRLNKLNLVLIYVIYLYMGLIIFRIGIFDYNNYYIERLLKNFDRNLVYYFLNKVYIYKSMFENIFFL